ncbi:MAG: hypothetical protein KDK28_19225 [Maritimibacter sp.]|nr:hypothetical protein [Maritimibacter sp.]
MRAITLIVPALALLAACATTPRQQCEAVQRNQLATVEAEIRETELTLQRGYRLVPARSKIGPHYCLSPGGRPRPCFGNEDPDEPVFDRRAINRVAETAKLTALREERARLSGELAQCAVRYPA